MSVKRKGEEKEANTERNEIRKMGRGPNLPSIQVDRFEMREKDGFHIPKFSIHKHVECG